METRILMLHQAGMIDKCTKDYLEDVVNELQEQGFDKESDNMSRMITHFAMALSRQSKGETVDSMDSFLYDEIQSNENFDDAMSMWKSIKRNSPISFSEDETKFMMLHLVNLVENK